MLNLSIAEERPGGSVQFFFCVSVCDHTVTSGTRRSAAFKYLGYRYDALLKLE